jgi:hypothetical protein
MVCLRVLAHTGMMTIGARALALLPPKPILPCRYFAWRAFRAGMMNPYFSVGPSKQREALVWLPRRAGSSGISWRTLSLVKKTQHPHHAGFEPQRASSQVKLILSPKQRAKPKTSARKTGESMPYCVVRWVWLLRVLRSGGE